MNKVILQRNLTAHVLGKDPFDDMTYNPTVILEIREVSPRSLRVSLATHETGDTTPQASFELPQRSAGKFKKSGTYTFCKAQWDIVMTSKLTLFTITKGRRKWTLSIELDVDRPHDPSMILIITGRWGQYCAPRSAED